jgi:hypothetical protein
MKPSRCWWVVVGMVLCWAGPAPAKTSCDPEVVAQAVADIEAACPCAAQADGTPWSNHGGYVSCVAQARSSVAAAAGIKKSCIKGVQACAANSSCGKSDKVACAVNTGACLFAPGACSSDIAEPCETAITCTNPADSCKAVGSCSVAATPCFGDADCPVGETCGFVGTCDNAPTTVCTANADCAVQTCLIATAAECDALDGTSGVGSCCDLVEPAVCSDL